MSELTDLPLAAVLRAAPVAADSAPTAPAVWRALGEQGTLARLYSGPSIPSPSRLVELIAALDASCPTGVVLSVCVQVASALPVLREQAAGGPAAEAFASAVRGESLVALAATDAGAGSDLMRLGTTARISTDEVALDGEKRWITNACHARYALVLARHRPQHHFTSFTWVLVPMDAPGVRVRAERTDLFTGAGIGRIELRGVIVGREWVLGAPGRGLVTFARHVATERLAGGLWAGVMCRRVLADTYGRLTRRTLGGAALWNNDAVRHQFARCLVEAWRIDAECLAYLGSHGSRDALTGSMLLKIAVAESLDTVLAGCTNLLGAEAFDVGGIAQLRSEASMFGIAGGATGAMLAGVADNVADLLKRRTPWPA